MCLIIKNIFYCQIPKLSYIVCCFYKFLFCFSFCNIENFIQFASSLLGPLNFPQCPVNLIFQIGISLVTGAAKRKSKLTSNHLRGLHLVWIQKCKRFNSRENGISKLNSNSDYFSLHLSWERKAWIHFFCPLSFGQNRRAV